ncbi:helix-turn-helix transcriptional regulator [Undibacterium sp. Di26W]|uniref:helix-turn-helix transcriptional regulator n=1 Tax=Undibacterium sp. Di26W TaxID=3413035 RepID=UPI003BF3D7AB
MGQHDDALANQIITQFYEGILTPSAWSNALCLLCQMIGSEHVALTTLNRQTNTVIVNESIGLTEACRDEFKAHYFSYDPALDWVDKIALGSWYIDHQHVGTWAMQRSVFYQDFMHKFDLGSINVSPVLRNGAITSFLVIQYGIGQPFHRQYATANLAPLLVHLQRALCLRLHCETMTQKADLAFAMLAQLRSPMLIADETGHVVFANQAAEALFRRQTMLHVTAGCIALCGSNKLRLVNLIRAACGVDGPCIAGGVQASKMADNLQLQILVTPLPVQHAQLSGPARPLALVLVHDPDLPFSSGTELLRQIYGLTISEARIALLILHGANPSQAAAQSGVSVATVRSQLRSVFQKTGTTRQAELMRLLSAILTLGSKQH